MIIPKHRNPSRSRSATAPYNFIPLPETIVEAEPLPDHNRAQSGRHTGYFDVELETRTPLYIRGPLTTEHFENQERNRYADGTPLPTGNAEFMRLVKNLPDFFYSQDKRNPRIPGSSLRGMLRNLLEIATFSKVPLVSERKRFYRTVDDTSLGIDYGRRIRGNIRGGFFRKKSDNQFEIEPCLVARIHYDLLLEVFDLEERADLYELRGRPLRSSRQKKNPNQTPNWKYQHRQIWVRLEGETASGFARVVKASLDKDEVSGVVRQGTLVLTGHMQGKKRAFVFLKDSNAGAQLSVPNDLEEEDENKRLVERFHSDDQITQYQQLAFKDGKPNGAKREQDGYLRNGEPVFFLFEDDEDQQRVEFFGRAFMFRLPYEHSPFDLVTRKLRDPNTIDMAEAMFGFVRTAKELAEMRERPMQGDKRRAYAGRVYVSDAVLSPPNQSDLFEEEQTPQILATPKPTSFQLYLTQDSDHKDDLHHYDTETDSNRGQIKPVIRGHKLYWHRSGSRGQRTVPENEVRNKLKHSTQHTRIKPVKPKKKFRFRVYFDNLTERELGALAWVLSPQGDAGEYSHRMGMGKSLGYGSVSLRATLYLVTPNTRYDSLFCRDESSITFEDGLGRRDLETFRDEFEQATIDSIGAPKESRLSDVPRIAMLLKMLEYPGPDWNDTKAMDVMGSRDFRDRKVLPDPLSLGGVSRDKDKSRTRDWQAQQTEPEQDATLATARRPHYINSKLEPEENVELVSDPSEEAEIMAALLRPQALEAGNILDCTVYDQASGPIVLEIRSAIMDDGWDEVDLFVWIERDDLKYPVRDGERIICRIVEVEKDEYDWTVRCRPTKFQL